MFIAIMVLFGCGGGDSKAIQPNFIHLQSDVGDYIGQGQTYSYDQANAIISVSASGGRLSLNINGDQKWVSDFQTPNTLNQLQVGMYNNLQRYPFHNLADGGINWAGDGRGCNTLQGWFAIDNVSYANGNLTAIDLHFEQHCEGGTAALRGQIHWTTNDTTAPPNPVNPPPVSLWQPPLNSTPTSGNFVYLLSDTGDFIGQGQTYLHTQANDTISVSANSGHLSVSTTSGSLSWLGDFQTMNTLNQLQPGYYSNLQRYPLHNPAKGGLSWWGNGNSCNTLQGWFAIDSVTYINGNLSSINLRFEQHCEGVAAVLHGAIHWGL